MMLTIHGLPMSTKYHDLKVLVKQQCNISDYILDNLVSQGDGTKKVRIGVTNEREGEYLLKCLHGYRLLGSGNVLHVEPVGKTGNIMNAPYTPARNSYPNQGLEYNRQVEPVAGHSDQWGLQNSQWGPSQTGVSQAHALQNNYSYQQPGQGMSQPYGQAMHQHRPDTRPYDQPQGFPPSRGPPQDQRYGLPKPNEPAAERRVEPRSHVLRSVEIIDEPISRSLTQPGKFPSQGYNVPQKPNFSSQITISKDNFQGPSQYNADRPTQPSGQYQPPTSGHHQGSWEQQIPPEKSQSFSKPISSQFDRKYPDSNIRQAVSKPSTDLPRNVHDNYGKPYDKGGNGPRFSPRRDLPKDVPGPRFSPRRDTPKDGPRFSPRRDVPKEGRGPRFSPRRDKPGPRFSPRREKDGAGPRFSPRRDKDGLGPRFSPQRDKDGPGPRFSPRRDKDGPGPRFSPRRDKEVSGPRFSPRRDKDGPGPRFSPRRDKEISGPRFSPRRDKDGPGPRFSPRRDKDGPGPRFSPRRDKEVSGPRFSPRRDKIMASQRFSPRRELSKDAQGLRFSPRRDVPKDGPVPRFSPRRDVPIAPRGRRDSPSGRRLPSPGHRISPSGRRISPSDRRVPGRRESPAGHKRASPGRRDSPSRPHPMRYSPSRRHPDKMADKYVSEAPRVLPKDVRPAYEPPTQAPNQAIYSGGYRPNVHENIQYPIPGMRQPERSAPWQQERDKPMVPAIHPSLKRDEDRRELRMPTFEPRLDPNLEVPRSRSPARKSRSPNRRDRSPVRDRYKKHSPSPRSPRRSWALEKRRSPDIRDAPPPPMWPGQNPGDHQPRNRSNFPGLIDDDKKKVPVWERPLYDEKNDRRERQPVVEDRFSEQAPIRVRTDLGLRPSVPQPIHAVHREPSPRGHNFKPDDRYSPREPTFEPRQVESKFDIREREPKFELREDFPERRADFRRPDIDRKQYDRPDFRDVQKPADRGDHRQDPMHSRHLDRREEFARREERKEAPKAQESFNKEIEDVYKRAVDFNKKTQEFHKGDIRRRDEFDEDRGRRDAGRHEPKDYDRQKLSREGDRDEPRRDFRHADEPLRREEFEQRNRPEWKVDDGRLSAMSPGLRAKREKAVEEIAERILDKHGSGFNPDLRRRVMEELKLSVARILKEIFGSQDVSFIEMVIKFNAKYESKDEVKLLQDVMASLPSHYRNMKRHAEEPDSAPEVPAKSARHSHEHHMIPDVPKGMTVSHIPDWDMNIQSQNVPIMGMHHYEYVPQMVMIPPEMVSAPTFVPSFEDVRESPPIIVDNTDDKTLNLYLCKDDFEPYSDNQAEYLKKFLVSQIIKVSESGHGWAPDFTLKGLQSMYRYELVTRDESTKDWILNLDFSEFSLFNVLVYTKEELWYERAAIWLPGHSRHRNLEPLAKLKLQNKKLDGVNIGKWKYVKKVITPKGTRVYVDMPPSSARALEKHKMLLSYELQKVSVYLKAVAVDKDAFDAGLKAYSITNPAEIIAAAQNSPMPSLGHDANIVKIALKGNKALSLVQARKIKEMITYHIFKYHQDNETGRTDFLKFGFCLPGYFGVVPENSESKRWLMGLDIGKLNRHAVVVLGADETSTKYIKMTLYLKEGKLNSTLLYERLKHSNQGVKGLHFNLWKKRTVNERPNKTKFEIDMDLESVETIIRLRYKLDYVDERQKQHTVTVHYERSHFKLEELVKKYKAELNDSYDVANMDIASSDDDEDIVFMGEVRQ